MPDFPFTVEIASAGAFVFAAMFIVAIGLIGLALSFGGIILVVNGLLKLWSLVFKDTRFSKWFLDD